MVYKYVRKTDRASWSEENMIAAVEQVKRGHMPLKNAAEMFEIPSTTLRKHVQKGSSKKFLGRYKPVFDVIQEAELVNYINKLDEIFFGLSKADICSLVYEYAESRCMDHPFKNETAGNQWYTNFMMRHPEIHITPAARSNLIRPKSSYDTQIDRFFEQFKLLLKKYEFPLNHIYIMGEICITMIDNQTPRIVTIENSRRSAADSEVNETLITAIFCCSAKGNFIPPVLIFPSEKYPEECNSTYFQSANGRNNCDLFLNFLKYFIQYVRPTENEKALLILENHEWYKNFEIFDYAAAHNVVILSLPQRCSQKLHPLHLSVFDSVKCNFQDIVEKRDLENNSFHHIERFFVEAYLKSIKLQNITSGFEKSNILKHHADHIHEAFLERKEEKPTIDSGSFLEDNFSLIKREKVNSIRIDMQRKAEARRNRIIKAPIFKPFSLKSLKKPSRVVGKTIRSISKYNSNLKKSRSLSKREKKNENEESIIHIELEIDF